MRIRTVKPEFWSNEKLSECSESAHMFAAALLNYCDDEGYFNANPKLIQAALYPLREPSVSVHGMLTELSNIDYLRLGDGSDGRRYGWVVNFTDHQKINRPSQSKIKHLAEFTESSVRTNGTISESSLPEHGSGNRDQGTGIKDQGTGIPARDTKTKRATQMPDDWIPNERHKELSIELGVDLQREEEHFRDYCLAHQKTYKDWDAGFRTWLRNAKGFKRSGPVERKTAQQLQHERNQQFLSEAWMKAKAKEDEEDAKRKQDN